MQYQSIKFGIRKLFAMIIRLSYCLLLVLIGLSCKSSKSDDTTTLTRTLEFGNGGGFTGMIEGFVLNDDGRLYVKDNDELSPNAIAKLDKQLTKQFFDNFKTLELDEKMINDPGDQYYFIRLNSPEQKHRLMWGGFATEVDPNIKKYYMTLFQLAQRYEKASRKNTQADKY